MSVTERGAGWQVYVKRKIDGVEQRWRLQADTEAQGKLWEQAVLTCLDEGRPVDLEAIKLIGQGGKVTIEQALEACRKRHWTEAKIRSPRSAQRGINAALAHFGKTRVMSTMTDADIQGYVEALQEIGNSDKSINRKLATLSKLSGFSLKQKWIEQAWDIPFSKETAGRVFFYTHEEEANYLAAARHLGYEDFADLWTFLPDTGARVDTEALSLTWRDVNWEGAVTFWDTKNNTPRTVPLTRRAMAVLISRKQFERPFDFEYWKVRAAWDRVRAHLGQAENKDWIMHSMRHTFCSRLAQKGVPLQQIKELAGHKSLSVTLRYAHLCPKNLADAIAMLEPAPAAELPPPVGNPVGNIVQLPTTRVA
jgi:integrase